MIDKSDIVTLNNNAVSHIIGGNHGKAAKTLVKALMYLKKFDSVKTRKPLLCRNKKRRKKQNFDDDGRKNNSDKANEMTTIRNNILVSIELPEVSSSEYSKLEIENENEFVFFNHAFVIDHDFEDDAIQQQYIDKLSMIVMLYNVALCHHRVGVKYGNTKSNEFKNALMTYNTVNSSITQLRNEYGKNYDLLQYILLLTLALWNNMGHIHTYFYQQEESNKCLKCIRRVVLATKEYSPKLIFQNDSKIHFFFKNLIFCPVDVYSIAAAA